MDGEGAHGTATLSAQTVVLLHGVEHVLTHAITNFILVVAFKTNKSCIDGIKTQTADTGSKMLVQN